MQHKKLIIVFSFLLFFSFLVHAQTPAADLEKIFSGMHSMRADFVEQIANKKDRDLKAKLSAKAEVRPQAIGEMILLRPGKFRWDVKDPENRLLISDGKYLWIYDADLAQVTKRKVDFKSMGTPALLLSGSISEIEKTFAVKKLASPEQGVWFKLTPKLNTDAYQWIKLHFVDAKLTEMQIADNLGQHNVIVFSNAKINSDIDPSLFHFKVPQGVDVVEE